MTVYSVLVTARHDGTGGQYLESQWINEADAIERRAEIAAGFNNLAEILRTFGLLMDVAVVETVVHGSVATRAELDVGAPRKTPPTKRKKTPEARQ